MLNYLLVSVSIFSEKKRKRKKKGGLEWDWLEFSKSDNSTYGIWATEEIEKARGFEREREIINISLSIRIAALCPRQTQTQAVAVLSNQYNSE